MKGQVIWGAVGTLCLIYGLIVFRVGSGTRFFAVWIALGLCAWCCAVVCRLQLWHRLPGAVRGGLLVVAVVAAAAVVLTEVRIISGFHRTGRPGLDCLVVLGAQVRESGPSVVLRHRLDTALTYLQENEMTVCIVSGGQGANEPAPEAEVMKEYLVERGIDPDRILVEADSHNTVENIRNSRQLLERSGTVYPQIGVVTNNFHLFRGCAIAKKAGLTDVCGIAAPSNRLYLPNNLLRECFGVWKDVLAGHMEWFN